MDRLHDLPVVLAVGVVVVRVHAHRAWTVERADGDDVLERGGRHALEQFAHGPAVELEHAQGLAPLQQRERGGSSSGSESMSNSMPRLALMFSSASLMTVRLRSPRKSIFSRPMASHEG